MAIGKLAYWWLAAFGRFFFVALLSGSTQTEVGHGSGVLT